MKRGGKSLTADASSDEWSTDSEPDPNSSNDQLYSFTISEKNIVTFERNLSLRTKFP